VTIIADPPIDPPSAHAAQVTRLLNEAQLGGHVAADRLLPLVYEQLRELARQRMAGERDGHTLQATALVHEAYARLVGGQAVPFAGRSHFFFAAAEAMRRILIDHARARGGPRRGGGRRRVPLHNVLDLAAAEEDFPEILALDDALSRLEKLSQRVGAVVRLRFYAGLSIEEVAKTLDVSSRTVKSDWTFARAWLARELADDANRPVE
jgi:RNA polymerase sigma factor (TIGR02999 family)